MAALGLGQSMLSMRPVGTLRGLRQSVGVRALLVGAGILSLATTQGWAVGRNFPEDTGSVRPQATQHIDQDDPLLAAGVPRQGFLRLAAKPHGMIQTAPPPPLPPPKLPQPPKPPQEAAKQPPPKGPEVK